MTTTRFAPWLCAGCGYLMDAASGIEDDTVPAEGDVSVCLNCGRAYVLHGDRWAVPTADELADLPPEARRASAKVQLGRALGIIPDLARRGGRT